MLLRSITWKRKGHGMIGEERLRASMQETIYRISNLASGDQHLFFILPSLTLSSIFLDLKVLCTHIHTQCTVLSVMIICQCQQVWGTELSISCPSRRIFNTSMFTLHMCCMWVYHYRTHFLHNFLDRLSAEFWVLKSLALFSQWVISFWHSVMTNKDPVLQT